MSEESSKEFNDLTTCQNCGKQDPNLVRMDSGLKLTLQKSGLTEIPNSVCSSCLKTLRNSASHGAQQLAAQELKANFAGKLWKTRTSLVRQGHMALKRGEYAETAILYEKYLKILQIVVKVGDRKQLDPKHFNDHPKEITVIASVLWDLMLVYDATPNFLNKQMETAEMLSRFLRFTPVYNTIIRKAEKEVRKAKNKQAFLHLLKLCDAQASRCFIANEAFGSRIDPTVMLLCQFRDEVLRDHLLGRKFIAFYYRKSPKYAQMLRNHPQLKAFVRALLRGVGILVRRVFRLPVRPLS